MSVAISWDNKMQLAKCDITVGFPISSHIYEQCSVFTCMLSSNLTSWLLLIVSLVY